MQKDCGETWLPWECSKPWRNLTIVGGGREAWSVWRRGRLGTVCARGACLAWSSGPSTSPLVTHFRGRLSQETGIFLFDSVRASSTPGADRLQASSLGAARRVRQAASMQALSPGLQAMASFIALRLRSAPGRAPTRLRLRRRCDRAPGPQGTQVPSLTAWARLTWRVCRLRLPQQSRTRTVPICGVLSNQRLERTAGTAEMSNQRTSATSLPRAVLSPLAAQAHR